MVKIKSYKDVWKVEKSEDGSEVRVVALSQPSEKGAFIWLALVEIINKMVSDGYEITRSDEEFVGDFGTYGNHLCVIPSVDTGLVDIATTEPMNDGKTDNYRVEIHMRKF
jgi:hypothetical protein